MILVQDCPVFSVTVLNLDFSILYSAHQRGFEQISGVNDEVKLLEKNDESYLASDDCIVNNLEWSRSVVDERTSNFVDMTAHVFS